MKKEYEYNTSDDYQIESPICDINVINYHMNIMSIMPIAGLLPQFEFRESDWVRERFDSMLLHLRIDKEQDETVCAPELMQRADKYLNQAHSKRDLLLMMINLTYPFYINQVFIENHTEKSEPMEMKNKAMETIIAYELLSVKGLLDYCDIIEQSKTSSYEYFASLDNLTLDPDDMIGPILSYSFKLAVTKLTSIDKEEKKCICKIQDDPVIKAVYDLINNTLIKPVMIASAKRIK